MNASDAPAAELAAQYQALVGHAAVVELDGGPRSSFAAATGPRSCTTSRPTKSASLPPARAAKRSSPRCKARRWAMGSCSARPTRSSSKPSAARPSRCWPTSTTTWSANRSSWSTAAASGRSCSWAGRKPRPSSASWPTRGCRKRGFRTPWCRLADRTVSLRRADLAGPVGLLVSGKHDDVAAVRAALVAAGITPCGESAFEAARIEWGFPLYGRDITEANLPQEVARDALAISFTKGCYLGQETVARIDALGHVNKTLVGLRFVSPTVPADGSELTAVGQVVGQPHVGRLFAQGGCGGGAGLRAPRPQRAWQARGFSGGRSRGRGVAGVSLS